MKNNTKIILGIDPGYDRMGVCVLEKVSNNENKILFSVCLESNKKDDLNERIYQIGKELEKIILKYKIEELAIEKLFFTTNQKTAMGVAESRGAVIFLCKNLKVKIFEYTPLQIKSALTGYGKADKNQVYFMLNKILKLEQKLKKQYDDEYDAIAVAYTHSISVK
jgi:crossover junction endodeoxyribonuclease RuvC